MKGSPKNGWRHGTYTGYAQHWNRGERPCDACYRAKSEYDVRHRSADNRRIASRRHAKAQAKALRALKDKYYDEYKALYAEWKIKLQKEEEELSERQELDGGEEQATGRPGTGDGQAPAEEEEH